MLAFVSVWIYVAQGHVVGAHPLRLHRLLHCVVGTSNDLVGPQNGAGVGSTNMSPLAYVHSIGLRHHGHVGVVVDNQEGLMRDAQLPQPSGQGDYGALLSRFVPELYDAGSTLQSSFRHLRSVPATGHLRIYNYV